MKRIFLALALSALAFASCDQVGQGALSDERGTLSVTVVTKGATKASNTAAFGNDNALNNLQVVIFDAAGDFYSTLAMSQSAATYSGSVDVPVGTYTVVAVADGTTYGAANAATVSALRARTVSLADMGTSAGMARYGEATAVNVTATGGVAAVNLGILPFRVMVKDVTLALASSEASLSITGAFLSNVFGTSTLSGVSSDFQNIAGRVGYKTGSADPAVVTASTAYAPALTYHSGNPANYAAAFYAFSNPAAADQFTGPIASGVAYTRLVLVGSWKQNASAAAETVYYPVTITSSPSVYAAPEGGMSYDVNVTIRNKGSVDPNEPPTNGGLAVTITANGWGAGAEINQTF